MKNTFEFEEEEPAIKTIKGLLHGFYEIYWKSGGSSLASVGYDREGNNWMAPVNWTSGSTIDWGMVSSYKLLLANDYDKETKGIKSTHAKIKI